MESPMSTDDAVESTGAKENFVGKVMFSHMECDCDICSQGKAEYDRDYSHFAAIEPLDGTYEKQQNVLGVDISAGPQTIWMTIVAHLEEVHGSLADHDVESPADLEEFLEGRVYEWQDITFAETDEVPGYDHTYADIGGDTTPNTKLLPVREVTDDDELADLGATESAGVDESVSIGN